MITEVIKDNAFVEDKTRQLFFQLRFRRRKGKEWYTVLIRHTINE